MVPVSLRTKDEQDAGGNMVGTILCNLATDMNDPAKRLDAISTSMTDNKKVFAELPRAQALALSAVLMSGLAMGLLPGFVSSAPPPFNIVISNVPGGRRNRCTGTAPGSTATIRSRSHSTAKRSTSR